MPALNCTCERLRLLFNFILHSAAIFPGIRRSDNASFVFATAVITPVDISAGIVGGGECGGGKCGAGLGAL